AASKNFDVVGDVIVTCFAITIADADFERFNGVEAVEIGDREVINAVDHTGVAGCDGVEPTAAAGTACGRAEFAAHGVEHVGDFCVLAGQWPSPTRVVY